MKCLKIENLGTGEIHYLRTARELQTLVDCTYNYAAICIRKLAKNRIVKVKNWLLRYADVDFIEKGDADVQHIV